MTDGSLVCPVEGCDYSGGLRGVKNHANKMSEGGGHPTGTRVAEMLDESDDDSSKSDDDTSKSDDDSSKSDDDTSKSDDESTTDRRDTDDENMEVDEIIDRQRASDETKRQDRPDTDDDDASSDDWSIPIPVDSSTLVILAIVAVGALFAEARLSQSDTTDETEIEIETDSGSDASGTNVGLIDSE